MKYLMVVPSVPAKEEISCLASTGPMLLFLSLPFCADSSKSAIVFDAPESMRPRLRECVDANAYMQLSEVFESSTVPTIDRSSRMSWMSLLKRLG